MPNRILLEDNEGKVVDADTVPTCPNCDKKMRPMSGHMGDFWGCSNYPACRVRLPRGDAEHVKEEHTQEEINQMIKDMWG